MPPEDRDVCVFFNVPLNVHTLKTKQGSNRFKLNPEYKSEHTYLIGYSLLYSESLCSYANDRIKSLTEGRQTIKRRKKGLKYVFGS